MCVRERFPLTLTGIVTARWRVASLRRDRILRLLGIGDAQVTQDTAAELKLHSGSFQM